MLNFLKPKKNPNDNEKLVFIEEIIDKKDDKTVEFLKDLNLQIETIIEQHNIVNGEHEILAELADKIKEQMQIVSDLTDNTNTSTDSLYNHGKSLLSMTEETAGKSNAGKKSIENMIEVISLLEKETNNTYSSLNKLGGRLKEISDIVALIKGIASQTNLLALNAAIEAARAGENGRGFAIVADEVRKLAEMTASSTKSIGDLINGIQHETNNVILNADRSTQVISEGIEISKDALEKIDDTLNSFDKVEEGVNLAINIIERQKNDVKNIIRGIMNVDDILKETNAQIEHHIQAASIVDKKLEESTNELSAFTSTEELS